MMQTHIQKSEKGENKQSLLWMHNVLGLIWKFNLLEK